MNLIFNASSREGHAELKTILDTEKIKYKVIDDDSCRIGFKVNNDDVSDFQMNLASNVIGARVPGTFYVQEE